MSAYKLQDAPGPYAIVHRPYPGEHDYSGNGECWCRPVVVAYDDPRTREQILEEALKPPKMAS
jgi:hypothetical protein